MLEAVAGPQRVGAQRVEVVVVIDVEVGPLGRIEVGDQRPGRVLEVQRALERRGNALLRGRRRAVAVVGGLRDAGVAVAVVEIAAPDAEVRRRREADVGRPAGVDLVDLVADEAVRLVPGERGAVGVWRVAVVAEDAAVGVGGRPQRRPVGGDPPIRVRQLPEHLLPPDLVVERAAAVGEVVEIVAVLRARRIRTEEEQPISEDRAADRSAELAVAALVLVVLHVERGGLGAWIEHQPLHRRDRKSTALVVVMPLAAEHVAAALGNGADHAAERPAVLGRDAAGLDLHFLQVLEHGVLARLAVDQRVGRNAVDGEAVLGTARAVHLKAALDFTGVDRRRGQRDRLERPPLRQSIEFLGADVVRDEGAAVVDERGRLRGDLYRFGHGADAHLGVDLERASEGDADVGTLDPGEPGELEEDLVAARVQIGREELAVDIGKKRARLSRREAGHGYRHTRYRGPLLIGHSSLQSAEALLRAGLCGQHQSQHEEPCAQTCVHEIAPCDGELHFDEEEVRLRS